MKKLTRRSFTAAGILAAMSALAAGASAKSCTNPFDPSGNEIEAGPYLASTFAYTHSHIVNNIIPQLQQQRDALLLTCDSATALSIANARQQVVYWSRVSPADTSWASKGSYTMVHPSVDTAIHTDEVKSYNRAITDWVSLLMKNEAEKVSAIHNNGSDHVATYSISSGTTVSAANSYSYSHAFHVYADYPGFGISASNLSKIGGLFGKTVKDMMMKAFGMPETELDVCTFSADANMVGAVYGHWRKRYSHHYLLAAPCRRGWRSICSNDCRCRHRMD